MDMNFTRDELVAAVTAALTSPHQSDEALTTREICKMTGKSEKVVRKILGELKEQGKIEVVWVPRLLLSGHYCDVPAYKWRKQ